MIVPIYKILKYYIWIRTQGYDNSYNKKIKKILNYLIRIKKVMPKLK